MNARNIATATTAELLAFFNANTGGAQVKKFADRKTAERRVAALIIEIESEQNPITAELVAEQAVTSPGLRNPGDVFGSALNAAKLSATADVICPHCGINATNNGIGYDGHEVNGKVIHHDTHEMMCLGCGEEFGPELVKSEKKSSASTGKTRPNMAESLKLDRRITHVESGTVYANACQVWKAGLVSASQGDRLSATLYGAAKKGDYVSLTINSHTFTLTAR